MSVPAGKDSGIGMWEAFVLGAIAPLGPYRPVHLAPAFPPARLNLALQVELPLLDGELLLALVDSESGRLPGSLLLTTRRLFWAVEDPEAAGPAQRSAARPSRTIRVNGMDYALLPARVDVAPAEDGALRLALGTGRSLPLPGNEKDLGIALARFLETVGTASRTGVIPPWAEADPALAGRIARVLPRVAEATGRIRGFSRDLGAFRRDLVAATPHAFVTPSLATACVLVFAAMAWQGISPILPSSSGGELLHWGANHAARVALRHQEWRLLTSLFVHGGLIHLAVNMWCLVSIGPFIERLYGNLAFAVLFLASGVGGAIASMATPPVRVSVGASGAIFGMLGALLAFLLVHRRSVPPSVFKPLRSSALGFVIFNTLFGAIVPNIDQAAHMGGLVTGFLAGLLLSGPWPPHRSARSVVSRGSLAFTVAAILCGVAFGASRWRETTIPPRYKFLDFLEQIAPALTEFDDLSHKIGAAIPSAQDLKEETEDPEAGRVFEATLHDLETRARSNLRRMRQVTTPDPDLKAAGVYLDDAQAGQIAVVEAARNFLATRQPTWLTGPRGVAAAKAAAGRAYRDFRERELDFRRANGLADGRPR